MTFAADRQGAPMRSTRQRAAVSEMLDETEEFCSAQELHAQLRQRGERIGLATVYRTLQALEESGEVDVLRGQTGVDTEAVYRRCSSGHHHHLVCRSCRRTVEVAGPAVETWATKVSRQHGFVDVDHTVEIVGTCGDCATS